jgi:tetratricopeptide (TPR) repeat protein
VGKGNGEEEWGSPAPFTVLLSFFLPSVSPSLAYFLPPFIPPSPALLPPPSFLLPACPLQDAERATAAYNHAVALAPDDSRLLYERDQLAKRCRVPPSERLAALEPRMDLVRGRDALAVEVCALYNQFGQPGAAAALLASRRFQPWEGGEGAALGQHVRSQLALGRGALAKGRAEDAVAAFAAALESPHNLGEAKHLLANDSEARYWLGCALDAVGRKVSPLLLVLL